MKNGTLHMIGNAHLDPVWLWQWQEGFQEAKATFRSALDRMNETDEFLFTSSSAAIYEWIENNDPGMFREIRLRVAESRWQIAGGWWIQPDCNIPSGESYVRQALYGQRYFREKFGVTAVVGYNVDSFGHNGMLPQLLKKSGMDYYIFMRPMPNEKGLPGRLFWWEADDGSRVLAFRIPYEYCTWGKELDVHVRRCAGELKSPFDTLMCFYGVGNHGGGPTKENLQSIARLNADPDYPRLVFSTPNRFFEEITEQGLTFPVVHDDLQHHASGCYAAHSGIKRWNRQAENRLIAAEKFSTVAALVTGQPYPVDLARGWKTLLFNQFHDILAGTSLQEAYEDARSELGETITLASRGLNYAIQSLAWNIGIPHEEGMKPIVVFNPHGFDAKVSVEVEFGAFNPETNELVDNTGKAVPLQLVQSHATAMGRHRLSFIADLPSLGYRVYRVRQTKPSGFPKMAATATSIENDRFRLAINPATGHIASLRDKVRDIEVFRSEAARAVVIRDESDTWSHNVFQFQDAIGEFHATRVQLVEHGPVKSVLRAESAFGSSRLVQDFTVYADLPQIDVSVTVDWREQFKALKLRFPVNLNFRRATYEIPYGHIERPVNGEEEPGQSWIDVSGVVPQSGVSYGVSLINDAKYSYDIMNSEMSITVLRSPIYAHHDPLVPDPNGHYSFIDQGIQTFTYSILPHDDSWEDAGTIPCAALVNQPPIALVETYHEGPLPQTDSFLSISAPNVHLGALKKAEDSDAWIVRLYEANKIAAKASISLPALGRVIETEFGPCEIKTFRVPRSADEPIQETNLLEDPM